MAANLVAELDSLDFNAYLLGPMQAANYAQQAASMTTVQFIQDVGFDDSGALRYVDFKFHKDQPNPLYDPSEPSSPTNMPTQPVDVVAHIPLLAMVSVPALRIQELTIDFNAKLTSTETSSASSDFAVSAELGINYKVVNFKASASYKQSTASGASVEKTYTLGVKMTVTNDELPSGLDRILTMLEDSIRTGLASPTSSPAPSPAPS